MFFAILGTLASAFLFYYKTTRAATSAQITATVAVGVCGNNIVEWSEQCDGSALNGETCLSLGFDGGTLSCDTGCDFDVSECVDLGPDEGSIVFSGKAYPYSVIRILKDGQIAATTAAGANGDFKTTLSDLVTGSYLFAVYAYDANGIKSKTLTFQETIVKDEISEVDDIIIPPTLTANNDDVEQGKNIVFSGYAVPLSLVRIYAGSEKDNQTASTTSSSSGYYSYKMDTESLEKDDYAAVARDTVAGYPVSEDSTEVFFEVEEKNEEEEDDNESDWGSNLNSQCNQKGDVNRDCRVNQIDFSIFLNWHQRSNFPKEVDLNGNNQVDLSDLSIMMHYWTG
ncbi:MAG: hypothetical protein COX31_01300 [Candidatus Moranbacteria bacterium CG23_combo_of_CG06-09_8_20_14_all_40_16]|nr:MAG: hypothetical protein COX31_01300 [Candidatus Moranbacteria bacterium CG23_combo_of_CG06-09_8_20_14_all_40_16]